MTPVYPNRPCLQTEDAVALIDTHCHLDCEPLRSRLAQVLASARRAGVAGFVVPGVHPSHWGRMAVIAGEHGGVQCAFGIHPMHADLADDAALARLAEIAGTGVAVGEIGLDPAYQVSLEIQEQAFRAQLRLAVALGLPVLVHCRRAFQRTLTVLREENAVQVGGIMHAFSGSPEMARDFIRLGFAISLSGTLTWQGAVRPIRLARELPLESIVLETDAPDMTPQTMRGRPNEPAWMVETLKAVAEIRGLSTTEVAMAADGTTRRILARLS
jgi:TatD DNase family protein